MSEGIPISRSTETGSSNIQENLVYKRSTIEREQGPEFVERLSDDFKSFYRTLGYEEKEAVLISSGFDPSVRFIGSHISAFKPALLNGSVPNPGYFMVQDCIRTQNAKRMFDDEYLPRWGSSFTSLGSVVPADRLTEVSRDTANFFASALSISFNDIAIRVNSRDADLVEAGKIAFPGSTHEIDTQPDKYYRHQIGVEGVWGRNFNLALRNANGEGFSDVGNIIVIEQTDRKLGIELALGAETILKQVYNVEHVSDFYPVTGLESIDPRIGRKLEDALITSSILLREGLVPSASDNRGRILRTYMRSVLYLQQRAGLTEDRLRTIAQQFECRQFKTERADATEILFAYIDQYRKELQSPGGVKTPEDKVVLSVLTTL